MAFSKASFAKVSSGAYTQAAPNLWSYNSSTETLATIIASGYFNSVVGDLANDDVIWVAGSDDSEFVKVTSATDATPVTVAQVTGAAANLPLADGDYLVGNASNIATAVTMSGHITQTNAGVTSISNDVVTNAHVNSAAAIALNKLAATTVSRALVSDGSGFVSPATTTATEIGYVNGVTSAIQTQLDGKASSTLTDSNIYVGNGTNVATGVAVTGDISISNTGVTAITADSIVNADVNSAAAIAVSKLAATTGNRALVSDASGFLTAATTTDTEIGYVNGVTSAIQTQIDGKLGTTLTNTQVFVGNGSNVATGVAISQDASIDNTGAVTVVSAQGNFETGAGGTGTVINTGISSSSGAAAVPVTHTIHEITTTGTGDALTLADGTAGQRLTLLYVAEAAGGDTAVLTPTTLAGGTTITFNTLGDSADLTFSSTGGWYMHGGTAVIA